MDNKFLKKGLVVVIIFSFFGANFVTNIHGEKEKELIKINDNLIVEQYNHNNKIMNLKGGNIFKNVDPPDQLDQAQEEWDFRSVTCRECNTCLLAQSFKPTLNTLTRVQLYLIKWGSPAGDLYVSIRDPETNIDLCSSHVNHSIMNQTEFEWIEFYFGGISVIPKKLYYIVFHCYYYDGDNNIQWGGEWHGRYKYGQALASNDSGDSWHTIFQFYDTCFRTYGRHTEPPVADFSWSPIYPNIFETIIFDASASHDDNGNIELYEWDWNNDGIYDESSTNPIANHSWNQNGTYPVTLRVRNNENFSVVILKKVYVGVGAPYVVSINGGFRINADIKNLGNATTYNVPWSIDLNRGIILIGKNTNGVINSLDPEVTKRVYQSFLFGIGHNVEIVVTAGSSSKQAVANWILGPLVLGVSNIS